MVSKSVSQGFGGGGGKFAGIGVFHTPGLCVSMNGSAEGNGFEEDTNAPFSIVKNYQTNNSMEYSNINTTVANTTGNVTATSIAIGNNTQIIHY